MEQTTTRSRVRRPTRSTTARITRLRSKLVGLVPEWSSAKEDYADDLAKDEVPPGLTFSVNAPPAYAGNMKAPMSRGMPTSQQILFDVGVEPSTIEAKPRDPPVLGTLGASLQGRHLTRYGFSYVVPVQQIAFSAGANSTHKAALDFDIALYDSNDKLLIGLSQIVKTTLSDKNYQ